MKKIICITLALLMLLASLSLVACNNDNADDQAALKFGMGVYTNVSKASNAEADVNGQGKYAATVAAVLVDADGKVKYTIKSDNSPFADVGDNKGISYTRFGKLIINGQEVQIVADSYYTEQHYIIYFTIAGYTFVEGETYEMIFTIEANDQTGDYCKNLNGYFALNDYTHVAG